MASQQFKGTSASASKGADIHTVRLPFIGYPHQRPIAGSDLSIDYSKDAVYKNCYFEPVKNTVTGETRYSLIKRPGYQQYIRPSGATGEGRGVLVWKGYTWSVIGNTVYKDSTAVQYSPGVPMTLTTSTGHVAIVVTKPYNSSLTPSVAGTQYLCVMDGTYLYQIAFSAVSSTQVTTVPHSNTGHMMYKDGYLFVYRTDNTLWNCDLDTPTTWNVTKYITAQMFNGNGEGLAIQNNLIFAFSQFSFQVFYDAANTTGSPMSNIDSVANQIGAVGATIASDEGQITWVSQSTAGSYSVYTMEGASQLKEIGNATVNRSLRREGLYIYKCFGRIVRLMGRKFYMLYMPTYAKLTWVYDFQTGLWTMWTNAAGTDIYPIVNWTSKGETTLSGTTIGTEILGQHVSNGWIYQFDPALEWTDDGSAYTVLARFGRMDLDTMNRKFVRRADLIGDQSTSATCTDATTNVSLQYSDDDYNTLSTARTMNCYLTRPFASNLGNFRRRAWQISYSGKNPLRLDALELKIRVGDD